MKEVQKEEVSEIAGGVRVIGEPGGGLVIPGMPIGPIGPGPIGPGYPQVPCFPDIADPTIARTK